MLKISIPFTIKPLVLMTSVVFGLVGCGTEGKPQLSGGAVTGGNDNSATTSNYRVRASLFEEKVTEPKTGTTQAVFRANYLHKDNLHVTKKYTATNDIKIDYKLGCDTSVQNSAIAGVDFKGEATGSVVLAKGQNTIDIPIEILHNPEPTENRKLCFEITGLTDQNLLDTSLAYRQTQITIINSDIGASLNSAIANDGDTDVKVTIRTNQKLTADMDVYFDVINGSAMAGTHFHKPTTDKVTIKKGEDTAEISIPLITAGIDNDVKFSVKIINKAGGLPAIATANTASVTISTPKPSEPAKRGKVNGTGVSFSGTATADEATCTDNRQDCQNTAPMQFTKLDKNGNALSNTATDWSCFKDETTGLIWEAKSYTPKIAGKWGEESNANKNYRDIELSSWTYRYDYQKLGLSDTGAGVARDDCMLGDKVCTTANYMKKVNAEKLCGLENWRLPTRHEMFNIVDLGKNSFPKDYMVSGVNSTTTYSFPSQFWTQSLALDSNTLNQIWTIYSDGSFSAEDPNSSWSTGAVVLVSNDK